MSGPDATIERSDLILDELATLGLTLARDLHARAVEAEDNDQAARLAMAFHHISRSVRQSLALQARLQRDRRRQASEDQAEQRRPAPVQARKLQVRAAVQRRVWTERPDWNLFSTRQKLDLILDAEAEDETFLDIPLETHIARIAKALGLKPPPLAEAAPGEVAPTPALRRSSA